MFSVIAVKLSALMNVRSGLVAYPGGGLHPAVDCNKLMIMMIKFFLWFKFST